MLTIEKIKIYGAGKTWMAEPLKSIRDDLGLNIISGWIDYQKVLKGPEDTFAAETHANEDYKRAVWDDGCKPDCLNADMMLMLCKPEDGNMHSGSLVELGHVTAFGKPTYIIGTCESVEPVGNSDRAWRSQSCVYWWPELSFEEGAIKAVEHYRENYYNQWYANNISGDNILTGIKDKHFIPRKIA